jgi:radical SAM protein with 4Fe4S-binding SPASM domain
MPKPRPHPRSLTPQDLAAPHPVFVVWELTLACDQACRHCGSRAGVARSQELTRGEALAVVEQLAALGVREVSLLGGEIYLRPDWDDIARAISDEGIRCSMVSGGRGLTAKRAARAAAAGVASISISVDGLGPTHDGLRAVPGSFEAALRALDAVREAGVAPTVNTQINRANRRELEELGTLLADRGVRSWQLQLTNPMGRAADRDRLVLQPWMLHDLMPRLEALSEHLRPRGCTIVAANNLGYFGPHEGALRLGGHWIGCKGGRFSLGIQSDGGVKACGSLPSDPYTGANLRERPLAEIVAEDPALAAVCDRAVEDLWGFCRRCYYAEICMGGCVWTAHTFFGRPGNMPFCHHRVLELKRQGLRERLEQIEAAPGRGFDHGRWKLVVERWVDEGA